ncbi:MAG: ribose-phosphate pyrophosphokinase [Clostridia bacterium]|nr:ribose-phosphate pyrophosphokinase [Clostridia bacterium]
MSLFESTPSAPLAIVATPGAKELAELIDKRLVAMYNASAPKNARIKKGSFLVEAACPRFTNGDAKGIIMETLRGKDLYVICDPGNHGITFDFFGQKIPLTPDEHFADLKRIISAAGGKPSRITVIMPMLYGGRQHRKAGRESLDCALMLQELQNMGVSDVITFDAHDPRVQNAVPLMGFDNYFANYQILKALVKKFPDIVFDKEHLMCVSPDEGAMGRNVYYATVLGLDLGMFYKRRDYSVIVNGRNPIVAHEYIGASVEGKDVFVADDMIATGDSVIKLAKEIKEKGAKRVFLSATFSLFTEGVEKFNEAYKNGYFDAVISTNLTYRIPELKGCGWFIEADISKYIAYIIAAANYNESVSSLLDPFEKIHALVNSHNAK